MRKGHAREGKLCIGTLVYCGIEPVRAANDEYQCLHGANGFFIEVIGKLYRVKLQAFFVEQNHMIGYGDFFEDEFGLFTFLLLLCKGFGVLEFGQVDYFEAGVVFQAFNKLINPFPNVSILGFTNGKQHNFHNTNKRLKTLSCQKMI